MVEGVPRELHSQEVAEIHVCIWYGDTQRNQGGSLKLARIEYSQRSNLAPSQHQPFF